MVSKLPAQALPVKAGAGIDLAITAKAQGHCGGAGDMLVTHNPQTPLRTTPQVVTQLAKPAVLRRRKPGIVRGNQFDAD